MASELGSMIVTEQIDAMRALGTDPLKKLSPARVATVVMLFFLTILGDFMGLLGGSFVASLLLGLDAHEYWSMPGRRWCSPMCSWSDQALYSVLSRHAAGGKRFRPERSFLEGDRNVRRTRSRLCRRRREQERPRWRGT